MNETIQFIYEKEVWYISALVNTAYLRCEAKACEIEDVLKEKFQNLSNEDLKKIEWNPEAVKKVKEMGKNISLSCEWVTYIEYFPYYDENTDLNYNTLGYFRLEVEYYKDSPQKKEQVKPILIQQLPTIALNTLREFSSLTENHYLLIDIESPIYVFIISKEIRPKPVSWSEENIRFFKKILGNWTEIYSGQWPDYSEELYDRRVHHNLSNRLSELHYIHRNSGFIYMAAENYKMFFNSYIREFVLEPTAQVRTMLFALMAINESLDILFTRHFHQTVIDLKVMEEKITNLKYLRGMIQTRMSLIYNELDYNRRQHYTRVLTHLIEQFRINDLFNRINNKFEIFYDSMQTLYNKKMEESQNRVQRGMNLLNWLFGFGILADLGQLLAIALGENVGPTQIFSYIVFFIINMALLAILMYFIIIKLKTKEVQVDRTVDAVIFDGKGRVVMVKRKYPPFKGRYAFPGGFIEENESPREAVVREIKEETNLDIKVEKKIGVFDKEGRDPRGKIISTAYLCSIIGDASQIKGGDDALQAEFLPIENLRTIDLAFDHKDILEAALRLSSMKRNA
ncbi:MAG: NUDIX domain-containing protein [Candidatus Helarchaeota archaeon]